MTTRRIAGVLTVIVIGMLIAELATRAAATHLPAPLEWSSDEAQVKAEDLGSLPAGSIVFVGSSMADAGMSPSIVSERLGRGTTAYNAALLGSPLRTIELWTTEAVVPLARPGTVVIGVSCREVNGAESEQADITRDFEAAPAMRRRLGTETVLDRITRRASNVSYLVRYRSVLRQPRNFFGRNRRVGHLLDLSETGMNTAFENLIYPPPDQVTEVLFPGAITRFRLGAEALESLERLVTKLRTQQIGVLVVNMPVTPDFISWMPDGFEDHRRCSDAIGRITDAAGGTHLDAGVWDPEFFADPIHLNKKGAARASELIANALRPVVGVPTKPTDVPAVPATPELGG